MAEAVARPRIFAVPDGDETVGDQAVAWCRRVGMTLDLEQELVLRASLRTRPDDRWSSFEIAVNAPRQNGKGEILMARELFGVYVLGERSIVHSAHEFKTSERHFRRCEATIKACPELLAEIKRAPSGRIIGFRYSHGDEAIELQDGRLIEFKTRTRSAMRGFDDVALLVLDEAMILQEASHGSMLPTVRASKAPRGPQIMYAGSAADQETHEHAVVWARVRDRGIAGADPSLCYAEWSLDFEHPDDVPEDVLADPERWAEVNFAIVRGRVAVEHMERELRSLDRRQFIVELLGVGDWPDVTEGGGSVIPLPAWDALVDEASKLLDPVALAFDVSPNRSSASISAAGRRADTLFHVELIECQRGTGALVDRLRELDAKHEPIAVLCDGASPAASLIPELEKAGVAVTSLTADEYAQACGMLFDSVDQGTLRHLGTSEVRVAVKGAKKRLLGDRWAWSRKNSRVDITPLVSETLALWGARTIEAVSESEPAWVFA